MYSDCFPNAYQKRSLSNILVLMIGTGYLSVPLSHFNPKYTTSDLLVISNLWNWQWRVKNSKSVPCVGASTLKVLKGSVGMTRQGYLFNFR